MSDIVERLRDMHNHADTVLRIEAADIIKRLRLRPYALYDGPSQLTILALEAETERLRADYSILKEDYDALRADNERLTRLLDAFHDGTEIHADNERLRTTLGYLADNIDNPALVAVAEAALVERRALEPKP